MVQIRGRHLLVEYTGCDPSILDDLAAIEALMRDAAIAAHTKTVASVFRPFEPSGVTGVVVVEESHLSIHTWPEEGYAAVDVFTCGDASPELAHEVLAIGLRARTAEIMRIERGTGVSGESLRLNDHRVEVSAVSAAVGQWGGGAASGVAELRP